MIILELVIAASKVIEQITLWVRMIIKQLALMIEPSYSKETKLRHQDEERLLIFT